MSISPLSLIKTGMMQSGGSVAPFDPESGLTLTRTLSQGSNTAVDFGKDHDDVVWGIDFTGLDGTGGGIIMECGGLGDGLWVGFRADGTFIARCGDGTTPWNADTAYIALAGGDAIVTGDGTLVVETTADPGNRAIRAWWNGVALGSPVAASTQIRFTGNQVGALLDTALSGGVPAGELESPVVTYTTASGLRVHEDQSVS